MKLTERQIEAIDRASRTLDDIVTREAAVWVERMVEADRLALVSETDIGAHYRERAAHFGISVEDWPKMAHSIDLPYREGDGYRTLVLSMGGASKEQDIFARNNRLGRIRNELRLTWFLEGYNQMLMATEESRRIVGVLAEREWDEPFTLYRQEPGFEHILPHVGDLIPANGPRSWSAVEGVMMGSVTLVISTRRGTHVSVLSQHPQEAEVIHRAPGGYRVESVEPRYWGKKVTRHIVHLTEVPA